ncbi:MAG TPA: electron transfer flavoprotein subunit alpha/FixB family protein [Pyrinomonadaceae bacterium]|nr:electron transfer flavoprotein subunit alpha/FixB family protein [Chloracidobacterium sp.]MBP9936608.1 electron transfer flavoprotein subunit alpha/FixB family protein [Pyrinomonadaceae bacterium]MBK7802682.1 electron transfer flavoprotein subunit alpha/FixB family protein [Chloracidobacterium sp.]MBK9437537.1 electron transfer flavoprotein subunit alpha/FixB family protein [Chloracidobacterium sp.]MBK9767110.1 electron transfer flavoprotein subunit alpha/FixB family protein [Chloracidobacte
MSNILVFIEHKDCVLNKTSLEAIAAAQSIAKDLGLTVSAVLPCDKDCSIAQEIAVYDIAKVIVAKNEKLATYTPDGYADAWEQVIKAENPQYVVMSHTYQVRDFAPKVAARMGREVVGDCIRYRAEGGKLVLTRRIFLGKLDADVTIGGDAPYFVTFQSGAFRGDNAAKGSASVVTMDVAIGEVRMTPEAPFQEAKASVDLTKSEVIVAVGRGIKSQENIAVAQQLADVLGADLAASRPICDSDWLPIDRQIGSSGQTVAPKLYIALGISGAIQHIVGMKNAGTIVAINKDAEAPIFDIADYGIVGDLFEAVPVMIEEVKKAKS